MLCLHFHSLCVSAAEGAASGGSPIPNFCWGAGPNEGGARSITPTTGGGGNAQIIDKKRINCSGNLVLKRSIKNITFELSVKVLL